MPLRIAQLVQRPQRRGAEVFALQLSDWLRSQGHEVATFYLYEYEGDKRLPLRDGDVALDENPDDRSERLPGANPRLLMRLTKAVSAFRPDIVQVNGARTVKYGAAMAALAPRRTWRLVYRNIDSPRFWLSGRLKSAAYKWLVMDRMDGMIGVSEKTLAEVREFYRPSCPTVFIPNGVDLDNLRPERDRASVRAELDTPLDAPVFLFIGALGPQKRCDRFLRVLATARTSRPELVGWILGDGPHRAELEAQARDLNLSQSVRFLGYRDNVPDFIQAADVYVSSSDTEGIPAVVIETAALGKPAIAPRVGGMDECIVDQKTGLLVPAGDEAALADKIVQLAADGAMRAQLGEDAQSYSRGRFGMTTVGPQYAEFFSSLFASGTGRSAAPTGGASDSSVASNSPAG